MEKYTFESDTCVDVMKTTNGIWVIDPDGENEEAYFLRTIMLNQVEYKILDPHGPGGGWPIIEYTGTKEQLAPVLVQFSTTGQSLEEVKDIIKDWDGEDVDTILEIIG